MIEADRLVSGQETREDAAIGTEAPGIRPEYLKDYIGQSHVREQMGLFIKAAKLRAEPLDHVLLFGPPGLGKTTLAQIIAKEMGVNITSTVAPVLEKPGDIAALLTKMEEGSVLFIDEIHRLNHKLAEMLYSAMEDFKFDIMIGEGPSAQSVKIDLPRFTLVGATTKAGALTGPLRARFGITQRLEFYGTEDLKKIVKRSAGCLGVEITETGAEEIAKRSRGTPRIANRLLRRVRDYAQTMAGGVIDQTTADAALNMLGIDLCGLDDQDFKILKLIVEQCNGGPVGLGNIAACTGEDEDTIEDMIEPYLLQQGYLQRTKSGRIATQKAYEALGAEFELTGR